MVGPIVFPVIGVLPAPFGLGVLLLLAILGVRLHFAPLPCGFALFLTWLAVTVPLVFVSGIGGQVRPAVFAFSVWGHLCLRHN